MLNGMKFNCNKVVGKVETTNGYSYARINRFMETVVKPITKNGKTGFEYQHDTQIGYVEDTVYLIDSFGEYQLLHSPVLSTYSNDTRSFHGTPHRVLNEDIVSKDDKSNEVRANNKQSEVIDLTVDAVASTSIEPRNNNNTTEETRAEIIDLTRDEIDTSEKERDELNNLTIENNIENIIIPLPVETIFESNNTEPQISPFAQTIEELFNQPLTLSPSYYTYDTPQPYLDYQNYDLF